MLTETQSPSESGERAAKAQTGPCPEDGTLTRKEATENLARALKDRGISIQVNAGHKMVVAKLNGMSQVVVLRGPDGDSRWCFVWPPEGDSGRPALDPVVSIGQEQTLARRILCVLELSQLKL